jgi:UPF0716 protein FxsA
VSILLFVVLTFIAEILVIIQVAHHIGVLATLVALIALSASGPWLVRRTGLGVWRRAQLRLADGEVPGREMMDGVLLLAAGVLLTIPGFITALAGLLLLVPPVRTLVRHLGASWLARRATVQVLSVDHGVDRGRGRGSDGVITADSRPTSGPAGPAGAVPTLEPPPRRPGDSPSR